MNIRTKKQYYIYLVYDKFTNIKYGIFAGMFLFITLPVHAEWKVMDGRLSENQICEFWDTIIDKIETQPERKPLIRKAVRPTNTNSNPLQFYGQQELTKSLLQTYLDRAVSHLNLLDERSRKFFNDCGVKFVHWAYLHWSERYTEEKWKELTDSVDAMHSTPKGADVLLECGIMECISRDQINATRIPTWLWDIIVEMGITQQRSTSNKDEPYFCYEAMFDRNATDWPVRHIGLWEKNTQNEQSVPDITMLETQLYYSYLIAEYLDAGFEGIMFGQVMLTGARDSTNKYLYALCQFARRWAVLRAYRHAVTLTSHVIVPYLYPKSPASQAEPLFTHITWPCRLSYTDQTPFGMHFGPDAQVTENCQGGEEIKQLLQMPEDLPILLEIDNYGKSFGPSSVCQEGWDEITAYAKKPTEDRRAFLVHYYFECRKWQNTLGHSRIYFVLPGWRCLNEPTSLHLRPDGTPAPAVSFYSPFTEDGGEEETIKIIFDQARTFKN